MTHRELLLLLELLSLYVFYSISIKSPMTNKPREFGFGRGRNMSRSGAAAVFLAFHAWPILGWPVIQPYRYRPPRSAEARAWAVVLAALSLVLFAAFGYPSCARTSCGFQQSANPMWSLVPRWCPRSNRIVTVTARVCRAMNRMP